MKKIYTLLAGAAILAGAMTAQNVIVVLKDGSSHKFNADYLQQIVFEEAAPTPETLEFKTVGVEAFSGGNVTLTLTDASGKNIAVVDLWGSTTAKWLEPGTYTLSDANSPFSFDPSYSAMTIDGEKSAPTEGSVTVSEADRVFTISVDLKDANGRSLAGEYVGALPSYTQWLIASMDHAAFLDNPQPKGEFYIKLNNDYAPKYELALVLKADEEATSLPEGTYSIADGSILDKSYVDIFTPYASTRLLDGSSVTVSNSGNGYTLAMTLELNDGHTAEFSYTGQIAGTPSFISDEPQPELPVTFNKIEVNNYGLGELGMYLINDDTEILLDIFLDGQPGYLVAGTYNVADSGTAYIALDPDYTKCTQNGATTPITSGSLVVEESDGINYSLSCDFTTSTGKNIKGTYQGALPSYSRTFSGLPTHAYFYTIDNPVPGEAYVKFERKIQDPFFGYWDNYYSMAIDFFTDATDGSIPEGTYTYAETGAAGTFGAKSYFDNSKPYSTHKFAEGSSIVVSRDGDNYKFEMRLVTTDGRGVAIDYDGAVAPAN